MLKVSLKYCHILFITGFIICNISCKKNSFPLSNLSPKNFSDLFEQYWNGMNVNYIYWDVDTTNWDNIYIKYKPIFANLDLNNITDVRKSVGYFKEISRNLIDNHYYLSFTKKNIIDSFVYPALERKKNMVGFHEPYAYFRVDTNYLDANFKIGIDNNFSVAGQPLVVLSGTINNRILYFSCNSFSLTKAYYSKPTNTIQPVLNSLFESLNNLSSNIKGLIIDVRSNYGGDLSDLNFLIGRFINKPLIFGFTQYKTGNGKFDFTPWLESYISPQAKVKPLTLPIVVIADNVSASLSEVVVMSIKALPNSIFVGETTFGATGPIVNDSNIYNDGNFTITNFMNIQTSSAKFKYIDGKIYEGKGFPPDIYVPFNLSALQNNIDLQLEKAITLLK